MAEEVRRQRQDIRRVLSTFVKEVDEFHQLMRKTGGILVGEMATTFFTGAIRKVHNLDLVLLDVNLESCAKSWFSLLKGDMVPVRRFSGCTSVDQKVGSC